MADSTVITPGVPSWVDLASPDTEASRKFYGEVFGWTATEPDPAAGGYSMFKLGDKNVAGVGPVQMEGQPPAWTTYVSVADAAATAEKAKEAGGMVLAGPMQVLESGHMAVLMDPTGAAVGVWQPLNFKGAEVFNVPGTIAWNELGTRDVPAAAEFYGKVFGWDTKTEGEGAAAYSQYFKDGRSIAGMMAIGEAIPAEVPANWLTYFGVSNLEATAAKVKELGGEVRMGPIESGFGPFAIIADPHGAVFAAIELKGE